MLPSTPTRNSSPTRWARVMFPSTCVTHAAAGEPVVGEPAPGVAEGALAVPVLAGAGAPGGRVGAGGGAPVARAVPPAPAGPGAAPPPAQPAIKAQVTATADTAADARHRLL